MFAGAGVYLLYILMQAYKVNFILGFFLIPFSLFALLAAMGFFQSENRNLSEEPKYYHKITI